MKKRNHQSWTWILFFLYMGLSIIDVRFGILGYLCMASPILFALFGKKKKHCSSYCPRASFLRNFLGKISLKNTLPKPLRTNIFRWILFSYMMGMFAFSLFQAWGDFTLIATAMLRMMVISSVMSVLMGFFYKERSWCAVCPMGFAAKLIGNGIVPPKNRSKELKKTAVERKKRKAS